MQLSQLFLFYIMIIFFVYYIKPSLFQFDEVPLEILQSKNDETIQHWKRQKFLFVIFFMMIIAMILFYVKVGYEYYFTE